MNKFEFKPFDKVLVRDKGDHLWKIDLFSHKTGYNETKYVTLYGFWAECIPYEGNEHLLGTTDPYVEEYVPKEGDFVVIKIFNSANWLSIFNAIDNAHEEIITYAAFDDENDDYFVGLDTLCGLDSMEAIRRATEEEKNLLLSKLHEIGKDWNAEKKEVVDWKWMPIIGDQYYSLGFGKESGFFVTTAFWNGDTFDLTNKKIGWVFRTTGESQAMCDKLNNAIDNMK